LDTFLTNFGELRIGEARRKSLLGQFCAPEVLNNSVVATDTASANADYDNGRHELPRGARTRWRTAGLDDGMTGRLITMERNH
jgi:hypothetical protein